MAPPMDEATKAIVPFLKRAEEIAKVDPLVAYYCRMYAMDLGMGSGADRGMLLSVLNQLEKDKVRGGDPLFALPRRRWLRYAPLRADLPRARALCWRADVCTRARAHASRSHVRRR